MKKIINAPETVVEEMCAGFVLAHPELEFVPKYKIVKRKTPDDQKVSLISGGGSGHEPAHAGYVGKGMLDAAVCGDVFASPSQVQVFQAIREAGSARGTLLIIKNYSGDRMNFKNAAHMAAQEGYPVDYVVVNDDVAVQDSLYTVGRRGVAGTVLVHKAAGAAAQMGESLAQVKEAALHAIAHTRSIGAALSSCTVPAKGTPTFAIGEAEMEYGVGIHGEPGINREKAVTADELAERMVDALARDLELAAGDEVTLLVNGFGGTPLQELYLLNYAAFRALSQRKIGVYRAFAGNYMTSIDMLGASVSVMKMTPRLRLLLSEPCDTPALKITGAAPPVSFVERRAEDAGGTVSPGPRVDGAYARVGGNELTLQNILYLVDRMGTYTIQHEVAFCEMDSHAGDGDFGMSVAKGFRQLKREWDTITKTDAADIGSFLKACALVIMEHCGGASGPIWGAAFYAAGGAATGRQTLSAAEFAALLDAAVKGIQQTGERSFGRGAVVGDKTLIDALVPCAAAWEENARKGAGLKAAFLEGAAAAVDGAKKTEGMVAGMGRAENAGERSLGYPDAGACALGMIFTDLAESLETE